MLITKFGLKKWYFYVSLPLIFIIMIFLVIPVIDTFIIICAYGYNSYADGLRFSNSKIGLLTNGYSINQFWHLMRFLLNLVGLFSFTALFLFLIKFFDNNVGKKKD